MFGSSYDTFQVDKGKTVADVLADSKIKETIGYGKTDDLVKIVNGEKISDENYVLKENDVLELIRPAGEKA